MECNKVILDLKRYEQLRDIERAVKSGKRVIINGCCEYYFEKDELAEVFKQNQESLERKVHNLEKQISDINKSLEEIRKMNYWEFQEWKTENKGGK